MWLFIVLGVLLLCAYVCWRAAQALFAPGFLRWFCFALLLLSSAGFLLGMPLRDTAAGIFLRQLGATWMLTLPYWLLAVLFFDALRFTHRRRPFFPGWVKRHYPRAKRFAFLFSVAVVASIFLRGYWNFSHPVITDVTVTIPKNAGSRTSLRAAVAADLHLGHLIDRDRLRQYVDLINSLNADIILLPGDIIDFGIAPLLAQNMGDELARLRAPLGVFAVLGNHERYGNAIACTDFLSRHGIRVLRDESVLIDNAFYLVGRNDIDRRRDNQHRATLDDLLRPLDRTKPIIVLDHQPHDLDEPARAGADFQLSGHTHRGQVWPVTWIVDALYPVSYGLGGKDAFQIYVTSGLGLWGFPARIGSVSEVVHLTLQFSPPPNS